jgi:hypothetical protein
VAVTTISDGHPNAHVAGGEPAERISTLASDVLLAGRGSFVSLEISAVLEVTPFGAAPLTIKFSVIVATAPLAQLATEQSTTPALSAQAKAEEVLAVSNVMLGGTAIVKCTFAAASGPALLSQRKKPVFVPGSIGSPVVLKL